MIRGCKIYFRIILLAILLHDTGALIAQRDSAKYMFRAFEDDDFINDLGRGTDKAYTSGLQFTLFYNKPHPSHFFLDHIIPKAGDSSVNTYGLGIMQIMYTPDYLTALYYVPNDYSYAGADVLKYSLYSFNPKKKYDFQTDIVAGVMGPASFAGEAQHWLHTNIGDTAVPHGWNNQYRNDVLFNINFTAEKQLYSNNKSLELIGDAGICAGTMFDDIEMGPTLRFGKMKPYFDGFMGHYSTSFASKETGWNKVQLYFFVKPAVQYVLYSAMLQGGLFSPPPTVTTFVYEDNVRTQIYFQKPKQYIENYVGNLSYGGVLTYRHWSITFTQIYSTRVLKGVYPYIYGNITIYYSW
jgi:hypothetical protein